MSTKVVLLLSYLSCLLVDGLPTNLRNSITDSNKAVNYFTQFGYLPESQEGNSIDYTEMLPAAIATFQEMSNLPQTGILDERTGLMMTKERCGVKDPVSNAARQKRYTHSGSKWNSGILTWRVTRYSTHLTHLEVVNTLRQAFQIWSEATNLYFQHVLDGRVDIEVKFAQGSHQDGYRFDGKGGILAHAFFPPQSVEEGQRIDGDVHFDDSEEWIVNLNSVGQDLLVVAVHEIGHSLGLQHSNKPGSIMWPWNKEIQQSTYSQPKLAYDDLQGIQSLYGHKSHRAQRNENNHYLCGQIIDAAMTAVDSNMYIFQGNTVRKLNPTTLEPLSTTPQLISSIFTGFPGNAAVDAAVTYKGPWSEVRSYLITGSQYYRYSLVDGRMSADAEYPKTFYTVWGEFARGHTIDTSFTYKNKNTLVFIIGNQYWVHTGTSLGPYGSYPRSLLLHPIYGEIAEAGIDAGFLHPNGTNYFFNDGGVYKLNENDRVEPLCA